MALLVPADLAPSARLADARREIEQALPGDDAHEAHRSAMLRFVEDHPDALLRSCASGHLTSSALVLDASATTILLLEHRKLRRWLQPGGHADGEANLAASAQREATEESGMADLTVFWPAIDLDVHRVNPPNEPAHDHLDVRYLVLAPPGAVARHNHESTAQRWITVTELDRFAPDDGLRRLVQRGLEVAAEVVRR